MTSAGAGKEQTMLRRLWHRIFSRPVVWERSLVELSGLEQLARAGIAGMLLAQEKARLDFIKAREAHARNPNSDSRHHMDSRLAHLQATNAVVQSLLNEQQLEQRLMSESPPEIVVGKSR
jgi:hypothetical protein